MPTKDVFDFDEPLPLFLTDEREQQVFTDEPDQQGIGKAWDGTVIRPGLLKAATLVATATAITIAILSVGNPVALFADVTASVADNSAVQPGTDQSMPTVQSTADAEVLPPTAKDTFRAAYEIAAASEPAVQNQPEDGELSPEALFREFQAWAAEQDAQAQVAVQQPVQDAPPKAGGNARASIRLMHKHRHVRPVHNARAEMRLAQNPRKKVRREQNARVEVRPAQDAPAQVQYVQNPFLQIFDWH
jgi:hypothetical protein